MKADIPKGRVIMYSVMPGGAVFAAYGTHKFIDLAKLKKLSPVNIAKAMAEEKQSSNNFYAFPLMFDSEEEMFSKFSYVLDNSIADIVPFSGYADGESFGNKVVQEMAMYMRRFLRINPKNKLNPVLSISGKRFNPLCSGDLESLLERTDN